MRVTVARPLDLDRSTLDAWRTFQRLDATLHSAFLTPEFACVMSKRMPSARVAVVEDAGQIIAFFPFEHIGYKAGRALCYGSSDVQGVVHAPHAQLCGPELIKACGLDIWEFDHLLASQLALFTPSRFTVRDSPVIDLRDGFEAWLSRLQPSKLKKILQREKRLERDLGAVRLNYDSRDHDALELLMKWKSAQYIRTGRSDRFARREFADSVRELIDTRTDNFHANLSVLTVGDRPAALHLSLCSNGVMADWIPAYDVDLSAYGVGLLLRLRVLEAAALNGIYLHDSGAGDEAYKNAFSDYSLKVAKGTVSRPTIASYARQLRTLPAEIATEIVLGSPHLRRAARASLAWVGSKRMALKGNP